MIRSIKLFILERIFKLDIQLCKYTYWDRDWLFNLAMKLGNNISKNYSKKQGLNQ